MPEMTVWPVSSSVRMRNVGSSSDSDLSALPSLSWSLFVFGSMATWMTGSGNSMRSRITGSAAVAQRVAGGGVLEAEAGDDVAGVGHVDVLTLVGVHQQDAAEALALLLDGVVDLVALVDRARVDAEVRQLAERVGDDLERQRGERRLVVGLARDVLVAAQVRAVRRRDVERARQEVDDGVEHRLDALVLERRAGEHGHEVAGERADADDLLEVGLGQRLVAEVLLEHLVVLAADRVEQLVAPLVGLGLLAGGDVLFAVRGALVVAVPDEGLHLHEVDDTGEVALGADRQLDDGRRRPRGGSRSSRRCGRSWRRCGPSC